MITCSHIIIIPLPDIIYARFNFFIPFGSCGFDYVRFIADREELHFGKTLRKCWAWQVRVYFPCSTGASLPREEPTVFSDSPVNCVQALLS